jgi:hypothetical protein
MIGPKRLSAIREELRRALDATGDDPIRWLEQRMTAPEGQGDAGGGNEVLVSLRRFLETAGREKRRARRAGTRK